MNKKYLLILIILSWLLLSSFVKGYNLSGYWVSAVDDKNIILIDMNNNSCIYTIDNQYYKMNITYKDKNVELYTDSYINFVFRLSNENTNTSAVYQNWFIKISYEQYQEFLNLILNNSIIDN